MMVSTTDIVDFITMFNKLVPCFMPDKAIVFYHLHNDDTSHNTLHQIITFQEETLLNVVKINNKLAF